VDPTGDTLTLVVSELRMHLRGDTYRTRAPITVDGRNVFTAALWRLDRLERSRGPLQDQWENLVIVIEYARARALERLRRFSESADAYDRVADTGSLLADSAGEASFVMRRFDQYVGDSAVPLPDPEDELRFLDQRLERWRELAWEYRDTSYEPLALEEVEAWEMLRLDWVEQNRPLEEAITASRRLAERHGSSKLYAKHLIRMGDLFAEAARREHLRSRAKLAPFNTPRYQALLDQAFASYELAGEGRRPDFRLQAKAKIDALLAYHRGILRHAP
jgi:tetratricopeptide (TPR) repeat protein